MPYEITPTRWPVQAWPKLYHLIGPVEAHIAGSYAAWHMSDTFDWDGRQVGDDGHLLIDYHPGLRTVVPANYPNDLDIFTYSEYGYEEMTHRLLDRGFEMVKDSKHASTWLDNGFLNEDNWSHLRNCMDAPTLSNAKTSWVVRREKCLLPIQLIKPTFGKTLYEVLEHFDFYAAKFAVLNGETMLVHKDARRCLDKRLLTHAHPDAILTNPLYVLSRSVKYAKKGYKVNYLEMLKMVTNAQTANVGDLTTEQLQELIQHFSHYLHGTSLGRGEDFRPTFEDAYGQWLRYLLDKKAKIK